MSLYFALSCVSLPVLWSSRFKEGIFVHFLFVLHQFMNTRVHIFFRMEEPVSRAANQWSPVIASTSLTRSNLTESRRCIGLVTVSKVVLAALVFSARKSSSPSVPITASMIGSPTYVTGG